MAVTLNLIKRGVQNLKHCDYFLRLRIDSYSQMWIRVKCASIVSMNLVSIQNTEFGRRFHKLRKIENIFFNKTIWA